MSDVVGGIRGEHHAGGGSQPGGVERRAVRGIDVGAEAAFPLEQQEAPVGAQLAVQLAQGGGARPEPLAHLAVQFGDIEGAGGLGLEKEEQLKLELGVRHPASGAGVC